LLQLLLLVLFSKELPQFLFVSVSISIVHTAKLSEGRPFPSIRSVNCRAVMREMLEQRPDYVYVPTHRCK
jgi:hypothetical protein